MTRTSQSSGVKIRGQKPPQKKSKKNKKKKKKTAAKKKLEITSEEEFVPPTKTLSLCKITSPKASLAVILQMMNLQKKK